MLSSTALLSAIVFLPALGALLLAFFPNDKPQAMKLFALGITVGVVLLTGLMFLAGSETYYEAGAAELQKAFSHDWIPSFNIYYFMALDGVSFPLVVLTAVMELFLRRRRWPLRG